jgi:Sugar (and other) transporter
VHLPAVLRNQRFHLLRSDIVRIDRPNFRDGTNSLWRLQHPAARFICFGIIDKIGRRPLAIFGAFGSAICYTIIAILSGIYEKDWASHKAAGWACVAMAFAFILVHGVSHSH